MAFNYEFPYTDPNLYNDDWLLSKMKDLVVKLGELEEWQKDFEDAYEELKKMIEDIEHGTFPPSIRAAFEKWMRENALSIVGELAKMVYFGITDNGYWVAYIPEGWDDIIFNTTGLDIFLEDHPEYGRLVLSFNIGGN